MYEVLPHQGRVNMWRGIFGGTLGPDWDAVLEGCSLAVNWPTTHYWREFAAHNPDAKIVLSWRWPENW